MHDTHVGLKKGKLKLLILPRFASACSVSVTNVCNYCSKFVLRWPRIVKARIARKPTLIWPSRAYGHTDGRTDRQTEQTEQKHGETFDFTDSFLREMKILQQDELLPVPSNVILNSVINDGLWFTANENPIKLFGHFVDKPVF